MREVWYIAADWIVGAIIFAFVFLVVVVCFLMVEMVEGLVFLDVALVAIPAVLASIVAVQTVRQRRRERAVVRTSANRCQQCEYDLTGNVSGVCPECGTPVPDGHGKA